MVGIGQNAFSRSYEITGAMLENSRHGVKNVRFSPDSHYIDNNISCVHHDVLSFILCSLLFVCCYRYN